MFTHDLRKLILSFLLEFSKIGSKLPWHNVMFNTAITHTGLTLSCFSYSFLQISNFVRNTCSVNRYFPRAAGYISTVHPESAIILI